MALRILVAIDEPPAALWAQLPSAPVFVRDGQAAYDALSRSHFDVIFLDLDLPGDGGMVLLPQIADKNLAVVLTSSAPSFPYAQLGMVHGSAAYLLRPLDPQEVADTLEKLQPCADPSLEKAADTFAASFRREGVNFPAFGTKMLSAQADVSQWQALYAAAVDGIYRRYPWLALYHHPKEYPLPDLTDNIPQQCQTQLMRLRDDLLTLYPVTADSQMDEILTFLLQNIDQDLPQKEVAKQFYIVGSTLSTRFQRHLGICYREYTTRLKMLRAQYLLQHTGLTEAEVSAQLGYKDRDYFNQLFLHRTGQTPQQVRLIG